MKGIKTAGQVKDKLDWKKVNLEKAELEQRLDEIDSILVSLLQCKD